MELSGIIKKYPTNYPTNNTQHSYTVGRVRKAENSYDKALSDPPAKQKHKQASLSLVNRFQVLACDDSQSDSTLMVENCDPPCATSNNEISPIRHITAGRQSLHIQHGHVRSDSTCHKAKNDQHHKVVTDISTLGKYQVPYIECRGLNPDIGVVNDQSDNYPPFKEIHEVVGLQAQSNGDYEMTPIFDINGTCPMLNVHDNRFPPEIYQNHFTCAPYNLFMLQTQAEIGFISLTDLKLYQGPE